MKKYLLKSWPYILTGTLVILYLTLAGYLTLTLDEKKSDDGRVSLTIAVPSGIKTAAIYREKIRQFRKKNPDISVRLMEISGGFYNKVLVMIAGNIAPDLMWMGQSFSEFADRGVFLDISDRIKKENIDLKKYNNKILNLYRIKNKYYSLPFGIDASFFAYNRKIFKEAGIPYPEDNWDFATFLKTAQALTKRDASGEITRYAYRGGLSVEVFGASVFDPKTGKVTCNTPEMINYFQTNLDLTYKYKLTPTPEEQASQGSDLLAAFKQGKVAMIIMYTMRWNRAFDMLHDMDWAMTLAPKVKQQGQWASSAAICIYRKTKYPDAAWRLLKSFQDSDFQLAMSSRRIPARKDLIPEMLKAKDRPVNFKVVSKVVKILYPTPRVPHLQELMAVFSRFGGKIFTRQLSPTQGMAECEAEMNRRIKKFKENEK